MEKFIKITLLNNREYIIHDDGKFDLAYILSCVDWVNLQEVNKEKGLTAIKVSSIILIEQIDKGVIGRQTKIFKLEGNSIV